MIYQYGGIYLDTDVEVISSFDNLLNDEMFCGFLCNYIIAFGLGFGAIKGHWLIKELRDYYNDKSFYNDDGSLNLKNCREYQHPVLLRHGFDLENRYQKQNGIVIYPSEVMAPTGISTVANNFTDKTVSIHRTNMSWTDQKTKELFYAHQKKLKQFMTI